MRPLSTIWLTALAFAPQAVAAGAGPLCPAPAPLPGVDVAAPAGPTETRAAADRVYSEGSLTVLEGGVGIRRGPRTLGAQRVVYDRQGERARAGGDVFVTGEDYVVRARRGSVALDTGELDVERARYRLPGLYMQGRAARIRRDASQVSRLDAATWSTCPAGNEAWHIAAERVVLDPNTRQGTARNTTLWFHGVPLFYSPWFRFPLGSERLTGFLTPTVGRTSNSGAEVAVPFYWNIAPNLDATLTPRWLERRGTQLQTELRWLGPLGRWQIDHAYLPDDREAGTDRTLARVRQNARFGGWRTRIDAARVSDNDYFDDLGSDLASSNQSHLERRAELTWSAARARFEASVQSFQTLDESLTRTQRPYEQVPRLGFSYAGATGPLDATLDTELVRFERDASTTATRLRAVPAISAPLEAPGWFLRPRIALDHTSYRIDRLDPGAGPERVDRTVPITSLDAGLIFDRFGAHFQQTLEPRLFYVFIPERDQSDIPLFDTGRFGFSFSQLFRERRFTGGDRIGDTNRLTLALTSRLLDRDSGRELLEASIGGIRYLDERQVTLAQGRAGEPDDDDTSDILGEVALTPTRQWRFDGFFQWIPERDALARRDLGVHFRGDGGGVFNLTHRFKRETQRQVDVSFAWPVSPRWDLLAGSNWSLRDDRNIESVAGVAYRSCCWRLRTVARRFFQEDDDAPDGTSQSTGIFLELSFRGLGAVGDEAGALLERAIVGYDASR